MTPQLPDAEVAAARQELQVFMNSRPDLTMADLIPHTTFSSCTIRNFASGQIRGGREVVSQVRDVIARAKAGEILAPGRGAAVILTEDADTPVRRVQKLQNFYVTQTVRRVAEVMDYCAEHAAIGVITADFGVGKTEAVRAWRRANGGRTETIAIEFDEFTACSKVDFIRLIAEGLGLDAERGSWAGATVFRRVCEALRQRPALLVFDQCELARIRILQILRQAYDRTREAGVGVVLLGAPILATRMLGSRAVDLGALTSRVGIWAMLSGLTRNEMAAILKQEGIVDMDEAAFDLWYKATRGSMRRLIGALDLIRAKHAGKRITERTIGGLAGHLWGLNLTAEDVAA